MMERKYWTEGDVVMGNCHDCGAPRKFADIIRMNAEDVATYKATYNKKETVSPVKVFLLYICLYTAFWIVLRVAGYSPDEIAALIAIIIVTVGPPAVIVGAVWAIREDKKESVMRAMLLKKYGSVVSYPMDWTVWYSAFPESLLILPEGETKLPKN